MDPKVLLVYQDLLDHKDKKDLLANLARLELMADQD